jgi:hypothetical protein
MICASLGSRVYASSILGLDFASEDATVVWDGANQVATSNNLGILGTNAALYGLLGLDDPSQFAVSLALTGVSSVKINKVAVIFSFLNGSCAGCFTINQTVTTLGLLPPGSGQVNVPVVPFFALLTGPSQAVNGDLFRFSTADASALRALLLTPGFGPNQLVVGIAVDTDRPSSLPGLPGNFIGTEVFTVVATPEPATLALLGSGCLIGLVARRRSRRPPTA